MKIDVFFKRLDQNYEIQEYYNYNLHSGSLNELLK